MLAWGLFWYLFHTSPLFIGGFIVKKDTHSIRSCIKIGVHCGRGTKTRTQDTWFWRPLLYQLSYTPVERIYYTTSVLELQYLFSKKIRFFADFLILQCIIASSPWKAVDERVNLRGTSTRFFPFPLPFCECAAAPIPSGYRLR